MNVMDVSCSSFLPIEDSADSEGDHIGFFSLYPTSSIAANIGHKEDDAESCTCECETAGICSLVKEDEDNKGSGEFCGGLDCSCSTMWLSDAGVEMECTSPNFGLVGDEEEEEEEARMVEVNVNDVDDKLFWEICIAVGYP